MKIHFSRMTFEQHIYIKMKTLTTKRHRQLWRTGSKLKGIRIVTIVTTLSTTIYMYTNNDIRSTATLHCCLFEMLKCTSCISNHAPQYLSDSVQTVERFSSRHSCLRQAEVQNQVRRARLLSCWTYCMEQSSTPSQSNQ